VNEKTPKRKERGGGEASRTKKEHTRAQPNWSGLQGSKKKGEGEKDTSNRVRVGVLREGRVCRETKGFFGLGQGRER